MARFLIEVPHAEDLVECAKVVEVFLTSGSHFLTHADWGCADGDHRCWIIVDVADKREALAIVPPAFRREAHVVGLNSFSMEQIHEILKAHAAPES